MIHKRQLKEIDKTINNSKLLNNGLYSGKIGLSLYYYNLGDKLNNPLYEEIAGEFLDSVSYDLSKKNIPLSFDYGIAGIGFAISYMIKQKWIDADVDDVLSDIDDRLLQYLLHEKQISKGLDKGMLGYMLYFYMRLNNTKIEENSIIFKHTLIDLINQLSLNLENGIFETHESHSFKVNWSLPIFLTLLSLIHKQNIHQIKIEKILTELENPILSFMPISHANRLCLYLTLKCVISVIPFSSFETHAEMIKKNISFEKILNTEFEKKQIRLIDGLAGLNLLLSIYKEIIPSIATEWNQKEIIEQLNSLPLFNDEEKTQNTNTSHGLIEGLEGIIFSISRTANTNILTNEVV